MSGIWVLLGIIVVVGLVGAVVVGSYIEKQRQRELRSERFRVAILALENKRDGALRKEKDSPDAFIAQREIEKIKQRYVDGEEYPV